MINPAQMMKAAGLFRRFQQDHPKALAFVQHELGTGIPEGSIIEMTVTKPGQSPVTANFRVLREDVEMVEELKNLQK